MPNFAPFLKKLLTYYPWYRLSQRQQQRLRWWMPAVFIGLFLCAVGTFLWLSFTIERNDRQESLIVDTLWMQQAIEFQLEGDQRSMRVIADDLASGRLSPQQFQAQAQSVIRNNREILNVLWLDANLNILASVGVSEQIGRNLFTELNPNSKQAAVRAMRLRSPTYSQPYILRLPESEADGLFDLHIPLISDEGIIGTLCVIFSSRGILDEMVPWWFAKDNQIQLTEPDGVVLAERSAGGHGKGIYQHFTAIELPGAAVVLRVNSLKGSPDLIPNILVVIVVSLSVALLWSLWILFRDLHRRHELDEALRDQYTFRRAMEDSLVTGLRARDLEGRVTYVNPAFCKMTGFTAEELIGVRPPMPYWAPEAYAEYSERHAQVLAGTITQEGYETIFQHKNGTRFPVLIFEAPLRNSKGEQTGWMSSILDLTEQKKMEELNRQHQEKLQSIARLTTMGELASTLSHELNQPLSAITSYSTAALNMLNANRQTAATGQGIELPPFSVTDIEEILQKVYQQATRAGNVIRSVHEFVRKREPQKAPCTVEQLFESIKPLVELQTRHSSVQIHYEIGRQLPPLLIDRVMLEQVLLNLTRNAIEAMESVPPSAQHLTLRAWVEVAASDTHEKVYLAVEDLGHGINSAVASKLFSPFFTTKSEGMGIGLNICRSIIEFHHGSLWHEPNQPSGCRFIFSLPAYQPST
ncbi:sensor histidine kinase [Parvibium lacunae]|uniref:histidine kinase n=1 Tax=Parvibium lacunae TaxID=1888893 RepID=A0A368L2J4_9BURK|nr:PAS domain S-box protein [Parvibium lacunae]RCS57338.1 PAS domain S-box protein [Parvibium lacunae]